MKHVCIELTHLREEKRAARDLVQSMDAVQRPVVVAPAQRPGRLELTYPREDPRAARREVVAVERRARGLVHAEHIIVLEDDERIGDDDGVGVGVVDDARRRRGRRARADVIAAMTRAARRRGERRGARRGRESGHARTATTMLPRALTRAFAFVREKSSMSRTRTRTVPYVYETTN